YARRWAGRRELCILRGRPRGAGDGLAAADIITPPLRNRRKPPARLAAVSGNRRSARLRLRRARLPAGDAVVETASARHSGRSHLAIAVASPQGQWPKARRLGRVVASQSQPHAGPNQSGLQLLSSLPDPAAGGEGWRQGSALART